MGNSASIEALGCLDQMILYYTAQRHYDKTVKMLLKKDASIEARSIDKATALHAAISARSESIIKILLDAGTNIEA